MSGHLTRDPETTQTPNSSVTKFGLAVNERTKESGEWGERPNFFRVIVWGAQGESIQKYLSTGSGVMIDGRLRWHKWTTKDGDKRESIEIVGESVRFMPKGDGGGRRQEEAAGSDIPADTRDLTPDPDFQDPGPPADRPPAVEDDIPF